MKPILLYTSFIPSEIYSIPSIVFFEHTGEAMSSLLKGNYNLKKKIETKKEENQNSLEDKFEKEAMKHFGGSIAFVKKKKVEWNLKK